MSWPITSRGRNAVLERKARSSRTRPPTWYWVTMALMRALSPSTTSPYDLSRLAPTSIVRNWNLNDAVGPIGVIGGPPCQAFSAGNTRQTLDDPRRQLVLSYARIL